MKKDHITLISLGVSLVVVGYLLYFTTSLASIDAGEYSMEKSLRNIEAYKLQEIYKDAAAFNGRVNSLMYSIVAVGAVGIALLTFLEYLKFEKIVRK